MICSMLASLWKCQCFQEPIYNPVEYLWWSSYYENIKPISIFTKKLHRRCSHGFQIHCFEEGVPWHLGNYRMYILSEMRTWHDNNIEGLHFPGVIKIVTTMIHYCYCLLAYGKWKCLKLLGTLFILKFSARFGIFTKNFCIWKRLFLKKLFLEEAHFNAYI